MSVIKRFVCRFLCNCNVPGLNNLLMLTIYQNYSQLSEKDQEVVELHEISADVMGVLLDFVYTETVDVSVENVQELLPAACLLQLNGLYYVTFL